MKLNGFCLSEIKSAIFQLFNEVKYLEVILGKNKYAEVKLGFT